MIPASGKPETVNSQMLHGESSKSERLQSRNNYTRKHASIIDQLVKSDKNVDLPLFEIASVVRKRCRRDS